MSQSTTTTKPAKARDRAPRPRTAFKALRTIETAGYSDEWYTPKWLMDAMAIDFELDPCSSATTAIAKVRFVGQAGVDGLQEDWQGLRSFTNPPYSAKVAFIDRSRANGDGVVLIPASTGAGWFQEAARNADAIVLIGRRVHFDCPAGQKKSKNGRDSALIVHGKYCHDALKAAIDSGKLPGFFISNLKQG